MLLLERIVRVRGFLVFISLNIFLVNNLFLVYIKKKAKNTVSVGSKSVGWQRRDSWYKWLSFACRQANYFLIVYIAAFHKRKLETIF